MHNFSNNITFKSAFVIKNYIPYNHKLILLHEQYGKIICMFPKNHHAGLLTSGSFISCMVQKNHAIYSFVDLEIISNVQQEYLAFVHDIMRLCLQKVPSEVAVSELFDFLLYVFHNLKNLSEKGRMIVFLRLFLMLDLLPEHQEIYKAAIVDPCGIIIQEQAILEKYVVYSWNNFYQSLKNRV